MFSSLFDLRCWTTLLWAALALFPALAFPAENDEVAAASTRGATMSDRERDGLHGPVKSCVAESIYPAMDGQPERRFATTTEYGSDGKILRTYQGQSGGQEWTSTRTYDAQGRILKLTSGDSNGPSFEQTYSYDEAGRVTAVRYSDKQGVRLERFEYDSQGHKKKIQTLAPLPTQPNVAYAGPGWEGSDLPFSNLSSGGTLTTIYNEQGKAMEGQLRNPEGQLVARIVRTLDENGRITAEKVVVEAPELLVPLELGSQGNDAQKKAMGAFMASFYSGEVSYTHDAQGHITGKERRMGALGEEITRITYNEHGDKAEERTTRVMSSEIGRQFSLNDDGTMIPVGPPPPASPPEESETRYTYQYDGYGNWTEQTVTSRYSPNEPFGPGLTYHRALTYY